MISSTYLYQVASEYENINDLDNFPYFPIAVIIVLGLNIFFVFKTEKQRLTNRIIFTSSVLIIGVIIAFNFFKPDYTFQEVESMSL